MTNTEEKAYDRPSTPEDPIFYKVDKASSASPQFNYYLSWMDSDRLSRHRPNAHWRGFATREEAVAQATERKWIRVKTWKEASKLAEPFLKVINEARVERAREADRRTFVTENQILGLARTLTPGGEHLKVWIGKDGQLRARKAQGY